MKLSYKILWVDDQIEDYIDMGIKAEFETYLDSLGFISIIETFENGSKAEDSLKLVKYDLILSDYNIEGGNEQGDTLIQKIRDGGIFTEVLFYSAQDNFEEIAKNLYRDRVSFFSLIGDEGMKEFRSRTIRLIDLTISKLQELNNIRGLVMSETSELDNKIVDILTSYFSNENENTEPLREYIIKAIQKSAKGNYNKSISLQDIDFKQVLKHRIFDADKKAMSIGKLLELKGLIQENHAYENFYNNYKTEVIDKRNDLAHAKSDIIDGVEYLILSRKDGEHPERFNQEMCVEIRKNLRKHSDILRSIFEQIVS
jgi:DNA-binding NarL/FixJ family response regulator